ncbi:S41 family peptidase [Anaerophilus nitritogenes]|uniref:S41 family peptidase n=1 Tax=Anaerophilus nitritogenes TaxID=2498136 RepID=UPI00101CD043|nr:S41 family peptidase [Anaerophilus nitritogenes]
MISKKRAITGAIILVLITGIFTFTVSNIVGLTVGDKVVISKGDYKYYKDLNKTYGKMLGLKEIVTQNYYKPVNEANFEDWLIRGMFAALEDPYSQYMDRAEFKRFMEHTEGNYYGGIGVIMTQGEDGLITVVEPFQGSPGDRAGLKPGDKIIGVDGEEFIAQKLEQAVTKIKGKEGTQVTLTVLKKGSKETQDVLITREKVRSQTVSTKILKDDMGYIRISMFDEHTSEDFLKRLKELENKNIKGLVIDLRNNPGGLLEECVKVADRLLGEQTIVYTMDRAGKKEYKKSDKDRVNYPFVLLVNGGSASASEILSGAVQDTKSGQLIGTTTFGKGLVQQIRGLKDGSGFRLTTAQYFTPNGTYIHGKGIAPDIEVKLPKELEEKLYLITYEEDIQLQKAVEVLENKIKR